MTIVNHIADQDDILELCSRHLGRRLAGISRLLGGKVEAESHGARLTTTDGSSYVNCAGSGVFLLGARNEMVVDAVVDQIRRHPLSARTLIDDVSPRAAAALAAICPDGIDKVHFVSSGTEATEAAIKLARANGFRRLISTVNGYHGKTMGALSVTARAMYQDTFRPLVPDVVEVPYDDLDALRRVLSDGVPSCFIVEPVQGEGGVVVPSEGYLPGVSALCEEFGAFLVVDEIQTGLGRVGKLWGIDDLGVEPDALLVGKILSGGVVPVSAIACTSKAYAPFEKDPLLHTSTYSGAPIAAAAVLGTIRALAEQDIVARSRTIGKRLLSAFRAAASAAPAGTVREVRGRGLLIGIEFTDPGFAGEMLLGLIENDVLANHSMNNSAVVRFTPPAIISGDDLRIVESAVSRAFAGISTDDGVPGAESAGRNDRDSAPAIG
ncbi:aspartate aminotransferase family protein [Nocardia sp. BMG51109]|uniref:aspartate aminotransferase family protein n=1 Tax=Nocardia sp. BMG51109 TaxID=1056816 RepID=UPI0004655433|nr:aminotransferase class III-fold pyridoxal phosphate-dependent enzyme [Nocardia sp. BMG51109]